MKQNLVIYYSRRGQNYVNGDILDLAIGNSERCAQFIRDAVDADVFEIKPVHAYPTNYRSCTEKAQQELRAKARPELQAYLGDISQYKNIFVCGPCWWGTFPMPLFTQLERLALTHKKVFPLMTHEGSGLGHVERDLRNICAGAQLGRGLAIHGADAEASELIVARWAQKCVAV